VTIVYMRRHGDAFWPVDDLGQAILRRTPEGECVKVDVKRERNLQHHRLFFAMLNLVADNSRYYHTTDQVLTALKIALGHVETFIHPTTGKTYLIPKSIAFEKMDQDEFREFFERCVDVIVQRFLPGVTDRDVRRELMDMCSVQQGAA
jgi:hypothetical protein